MKEFVLIFRMTKDDQPSPAQMQERMKLWQDWMGGIAAQNKLASSGNRLGTEGKVVKPKNVVTNGPYVEIKETIGGYIIIKAETIDEAAEISKGCPIIQGGGNVEVRPIVSME